jgi:TonB family protein
MLMALLASIGAHMPPWIGLGALADYFQHKEQEREKAKPVEVSFEVPPSEPAAEPPKPEPPKPLRAQKPKPARQKPEPQKLPAPMPEPEKKKEEKLISQLELPKPPPEPAQQRRQSITQKSEDPNVEPPPDAKYLAEESRRVEEETVAKVTDETKNDPDPQAAAPQAPGPEESGDSLKDERGREKGGDTRDEIASSSQRQPQPEPAPANQPARPSQPKLAPQQQVPQAPTIVHDPMGSFVLAPSRAAQAGQRGREGSEGQPANLKVSWRAFEQTFGAEQLAQDRMPREAKRRGAGREKRWSEFRAAVENYVAGVKPGNTTALNAAADPFAAYLAAFHRNLHMEFAQQFLGSLPIGGEFGDPQLMTKVEIVINPDGTLDRVGVVKSSGNLMYDFGAFNAVQRGAPYPPTPEKIRSPDGRTYMRWALHRNESQCGTWNAEPYILKNPPRSPNDPKQDNVSPYRPSGDSEHGRAPRDEPGKGHEPGNDQPAVAPGETLGQRERRLRAAG